MDKDFLLRGDTAKHLYYDYASPLPIIDYHNHLSIPDAVNNRKYENITRIWLEPDPYKHRLMRMLGVPERLITGDAGDKEKFFAWCRAFPLLVQTPVYHWARMELDRVFSVEDEICEENAEMLWNKLNSMLEKEEYSSGGILKKFNVEYSAPCTSLFSDISVFIGKKGLTPSLRGDDICAPTEDIIKKASANTLSEYEKYIEKRIDDFHKVGCRFSDHALDNGFKYYSEDGENEKRFNKIAQGEILNAEEMSKLSCRILRKLFREYKRHNWSVQLHIGAQRYTSSRLRRLAGAAGGYAGIGNSADIASITKMFDELEISGDLARIILFTLNPRDNEMLGVLSGSYSSDDAEGLIVQGPAWWWCDHKKGIEEVLDSVSNFGLLANFSGMTTDSRSILSFVRHEYFRRVLCSYLGEKIDSGELIANEGNVKEIIERICYKNAKKRIEV